MRQRHKRILTFTGFGFIIGLLGVALTMQVWTHQRQVEDAAVARSLSVAKEISASRTASEQARQHAKNQTTQSATMSQVALMLDLRTDFSLPCKLIAEEHFLYDSIFTRI